MNRSFLVKHVCITYLAFPTYIFFFLNSCHTETVFYIIQFCVYIMKYVVKPHLLCNAEDDKCVYYFQQKQFVRLDFDKIFK